MTNAIEIEGIALQFPTGKGSFQALKQLSLDVKQGEVLGIIAVSYTHLTLPTKRIV